MINIFNKIKENVENFTIAEVQGWAKVGLQL